MNFTDILNFLNGKVPFWLILIIIVIAAGYEMIVKRSLNKYKHQLDIQNHTYEHKFDLEMDIYKDIFNRLIKAKDYSGTMLNMWDSQSPDSKEQEQDIKNRDMKFIDGFDKFSQIVREDSPFYPKIFYNKLIEIIEIMGKLHTLFFDYYFSLSIKKSQMPNAYQEADEYHKQIASKTDKLIEMVRDHINRMTFSKIKTYMILPHKVGQLFTRL